jgi:hypothetical protein
MIITIAMAITAKGGIRNPDRQPFTGYDEAACSSSFSNPNSFISFSGKNRFKI